MNKKFLAACAACLLIGAVAGRMFPRETGEGAFSGTAANSRPERQAPGATSSSSSDMRRSGGAPSRFEGRHSSNGIEPAGASVKQGLVTVPAALIGELSLAAGERSGGQQLFGNEGRIEEILQIKDYEKARVQTAWIASRQKIRDLETASMKTETIDEWSVRVTVPDLSDDMASLGDGFRSKVHEALGDNRAETFMAVKQTDRTFSPPAGERTYTVTTEEIGDGKWRYRFELDGPSGRRVWVGENIPEEIRHLTDAARIQPLGQ